MIKGIDSQIIVGRASEIMKENSTILKSGENSALFGNMMVEQEALENTTTVRHTEKSTNQKITDESKKKQERDGENSGEENQGNGEERTASSANELIIGKENPAYAMKTSIDIHI